MNQAFNLLVVLCLILCYLTTNTANPNCIEKNQLPKFHLLKSCWRSQKKIINLGNFKTITECKQFSWNSKGLAINFSPQNRRRNQFFINDEIKNISAFPSKSLNRDILNQPEEFWNCHVLACPETVNFSSLVRDSRFDYYTLYGNPPPVNSTCIPEIGIFQLHMFPFENYSTAFRTCKGSFNVQGALVHIISEMRTNYISKLLRTPRNETELENIKIPRRKFKFAYVGLNSSTVPFPGCSRNFRTSENESLDCFLFRAWSPGHPKFNENSSCVAITTDNSWITLNCEQKIPFICEIYTSGPLNHVEKIQC